MSIRDNLTTVGESDIHPPDAEEHKDWLVALDIYDDSLWDSTNICALAEKLEHEYGEGAAEVMPSDCCLYLILKPGIDWDFDKLDYYLGLMENGHHFNEAAFAKAEMEQAEEFWDTMTRSDRIRAAQQAGVSPRHAFLAGKPPNEVYEHLIEYMSQ